MDYAAISDAGKRFEKETKINKKVLLFYLKEGGEFLKEDRCQMLKPGLYFV